MQKICFNVFNVYVCFWAYVSASDSVSIHEVDAHNVVPIWVAIWLTIQH